MRRVGGKRKKFFRGGRGKTGKGKRVGGEGCDLREEEGASLPNGEHGGGRKREW